MASCEADSPVCDQRAIASATMGRNAPSDSTCVWVCPLEDAALAANNGPSTSMVRVAELLQRAPFTALVES